MFAQTDGLAEGFDEDFTVRTGPHVLADLRAHLTRQLIINVRGQCSENLQAVAFGPPPMRGIVSM